MTETYDRFFLSYSGIALPLKLVGEISVDQLDNRNTYFGIKEDNKGRTLLIHKIVYGEIELEHKYGYTNSGDLNWAEIKDIEGEIQKLNF